MNPQRPQRPVGVLLSALALGLTAAFLLLFAFTTIVGAAASQHLGAAAGMPQSPAFTAAVMGIMVLIYLALAGWSIATLIGLLRMRSWARVSTMVIAGGLAFLGLLSAVAMFGMQSLFAAGNIPLPPNVPPALLHRIIVVIAAASLVLAALATAWLIYLAQRKTRESFARAHAEQLLSAWPAPPSTDTPPYPPARTIAWPQPPALDPPHRLHRSPPPHPHRPPSRHRIPCLEPRYRSPTRPPALAHHPPSRRTRASAPDAPFL